MLKRDRTTTILLTGASGFIGKYLLDNLKEKYQIIAMARRSGTEAGVPFHPNVRWVQWDIGNKLN
ncbi:MAG: NAD-dependent epimerase/dehydratase family protein, partial [Bacteroidales bacterium]|nr:NAD-dependent epimerase/dehydratase family protein [Bacteroidales bacterium]